MGSDKALLKINGVTIIERIYLQIKDLLDKVILISNDTVKYKFLGIKIYKDIIPGFGPLSGVHSGLFHSKTDSNFVISCDTPLVSKEIINFIISMISSHDIIIPKLNEEIHPLVAIYKKSCFPIADELLKKASEQIQNKNGKTKIKLYDLVNSMNTNFVDLSGEKFSNKNLLLNMNTLDDYEKVKNYLC